MIKIDKLSKIKQKMEKKDKIIMDKLNQLDKIINNLIEENKKLKQENLLLVYENKNLKIKLK